MILRNSLNVWSFLKRLDTCDGWLSLGAQRTERSSSLSEGIGVFAFLCRGMVSISVFLLHTSCRLSQSPNRAHDSRTCLSLSGFFLILVREQIARRLAG